MLLFFLLPAALALAAEPIRLHPGNPHYFLFRGKPTVLITSAEHYGAVLNGGFDYAKYLDTLAKDGLNMTRIFSGAYREAPDDFGILRNTLAPEHAQFLSPWVRSAVSGAADGLNKFDLKSWNPAYFDRLKDFVMQAGRRGIVVEVTLFCTYYRDHMWKLSPLNEANNINGIGAGVTNTSVLTMKDKGMVATQEALVRKMVSELKDFDNVIFEICNEPYFAGVTLEWQAHIAKTIAAVGSGHLIAQNIANNQQLVLKPDPHVKLLNFHYARPPVTAAMNYHHNLAIGLDETGFDGTLDSVYRIQAWDFLLAGGAHYNNLDYSFAVNAEDGSFRVPGDQPGGGSPMLRRQLGGLVRFLAGFDLVTLKPDANLVSSVVPADASVRALSEPGRQYALYLHHGRVMADYRPRYIVRTRTQTATLTLQLPPGSYSAKWWNPRTGEVQQGESFEHTGSGKVLVSPEYSEDVALEVRAK